MKPQYDVFRWVGDEPDGWELYGEKCSAREAIVFIRELEFMGHDRDVSILVERRESDEKVQGTLV